MKRVLLYLLLFVLAACNDEGAVVDVTRYVDTSSEEKVDCAAIQEDSRTFTMVTFGQSNAANTVLGPPPENLSGVYMFFDGECYQVTNSILGASGRLGSQWPYLARLLIDGGEYDNVLISASAISGSSIKVWSLGSPALNYVTDQIDSLRTSGFYPDGIFFQQGETDALERMSFYEYSAYLMNMLVQVRSTTGGDVPIYIARSSYCKGWAYPEITIAQEYVVNMYPDVFVGPYTDVLVFGYRYDDCHFNHYGAMELANLWYNGSIQ